MKTKPKVTWTETFIEEPMTKDTKPQIEREDWKLNILKEHLALLEAENIGGTVTRQEKADTSPSPYPSPSKSPSKSPSPYPDFVSSPSVYPYGNPEKRLLKKLRKKRLFPQT